MLPLMPQGHAVKYPSCHRIIFRVARPAQMRQHYQPFASRRGQLRFPVNQPVYVSPFQGFPVQETARIPFEHHTRRLGPEKDGIPALYRMVLAGDGPFLTIRDKPFHRRAHRQAGSGSFRHFPREYLPGPDASAGLVQRAGHHQGTSGKAGLPGGCGAHRPHRPAAAHPLRKLFLRNSQITEHIPPPAIPVDVIQKGGGP